MSGFWTRKIMFRCVVPVRERFTTPHYYMPHVLLLAVASLMAVSASEPFGASGSSNLPSDDFESPRAAKAYKALLGKALTWVRHRDMRCAPRAGLTAWVGPLYPINAHFDYHNKTLLCKEYCRS